MKKLSFLVAALAMVSMVFTSCKKDEPKDEPTANQLYDGFYLVGEATAVADFNSSDIALAYMGAGFNEAVKEKRAGMYEKYVALEADKPFKFILHEAGKTDVTYGGSLEKKMATAEGGLAEIEVFWGQLAENVEMKVPVSGLYHVVLDLNLDGQLTATGGKQIMLVPVAWGIRGGFIDANWNNTIEATSASKFDKKHMEFSFKDVVVKKDDAFKFVQADCWKIYLDMMGQVKCETSLGIENGEITTFGEEINFSIERGIYDLKLTWDLKGGACGKSFTYASTKTGEPAAESYVPTDHKLGISGTMNGWGAPAGLYLAQYNEGKSEITDQATSAGNYVYVLKGLTFEAGAQFKFRFDEDWIGLSGIEITGVEASEADGNITIPEGCYDIEYVVVWDGAQAKYKANFAPGTPSEVVYANIAVTALVPADWDKCYIWAWSDANGANYSGGEWPGEELAIENGKVTKVATPLNVIFSNGAGVQTIDITNVEDGAEIDIQANLKQ